MMKLDKNSYQKKTQLDILNKYLSIDSNQNPNMALFKVC